MCAAFLCGAFVFAQNADNSSTNEDASIDDMFTESEDVHEAVKSEVKEEKFSDSMLFKTFSLTGNFKAEFGGFYNYSYSDNSDAGGVFSLENTLFLSARASKDLSINGSVFTSLKDKFTISLKTLYFDYLIFDTIFVTAGKRSFTWGYPILFGNSDLYGGGKDSTNEYGLPYAGPLYTNILEISDNHAVFQVKVPWTSGTFTAMALYDFDKLTGNASWKNLAYAGSLEFTIWNQIINIFGRTYAPHDIEKEIKADGTKVIEHDEKMHPILGLETKRSILGTDFYAQSQIRMQDFEEFNEANLDYIIATGGFYKLFDQFDPNIGFVIEYQYVYDPNLTKEMNHHNHKIAIEAGLRRLGKRKNLQAGIDWGHNFSSNSGTLAGAFYITDIFRHGKWKNLVGFSYGGVNETPKVMVGSIISISMSY